MVQSRWFQNTILTLVAIILLLVLFYAFTLGNRAGQSKSVLTDVAVLQQGFQYFYNDQGRFPTALEFSDTNLMRAYMTNFPPQQFVSGPCEKSLEYRSATAQTYELQFCLPKGKSGWPAGWSVVKPN